MECDRYIKGRVSELGVLKEVYSNDSYVVRLEMAYMWRKDIFNCRKSENALVVAWD